MSQFLGRINDIIDSPRQAEWVRDLWCFNNIGVMIYCFPFLILAMPLLARWSRIRPA